MFGGRDDAGLYIGYLDAHASVDQVYSSANAGSVNMDAYSLGAYATHVAPQGWYLDGVLQGTWLGDVKGYTPLTGIGVSGSAFAASLEGGYPYHFATSWTLEPQAQLIYPYVDIGSGTAFSARPASETPTLRSSGAKLSYVSPPASTPPRSR